MRAQTRWPRRGGWTGSIARRRSMCRCMVSRDGPIAAIDPKTGGVLGQATAGAAPGDAVADSVDAAMQVVEADAPPVELLAVRPSWVRVTAADGTVLFEKILDAGERYVVPQMEAPATLRAGNSGSVYFAVNGQTYGPAAPGAQVVKNVALSPDALTSSYQVADLTADPDLATISRRRRYGSGSAANLPPTERAGCCARLARLSMGNSGPHKASPMSHNPIRPWRNIERRKSRQIMVGKVPVGGDAPITVQTMTNTLTTDVAATIEQVQRCADAGADIVRVSTPDEESTRALREIVRGKPGADRRRHPFPLQARHRGGRGGRRLPADQPRQHRRRRARARGDPGRQGPRLFDPHRRERRVAGEAPAGEIRRALPGGDGRKRARPHQDPAGQRFPRIQDQREGVRRVPGRRGLSAACRRDGCADPSRHHRGGRADVAAR